MSRRITYVLAGGLFAVASVLGLLMFTGGLTAHASGSTTVYRATADIAPGTPAASLNERTIEKVQVDSSTVPMGAVTELPSLAGKRSVQTVFRGQVLIQQQWSEAASTGGLAIPAGMNAISVQVSDQERVAGFVQPGSQVAVYATIGDKTVMILKDAQVIAVGAAATGVPDNQKAGATTGNSGVPTEVVTLALNAADSAKLVNAKETGTVHLGLLNPGS